MTPSPLEGQNLGFPVFALAACEDKSPLGPFGFNFSQHGPTWRGLQRKHLCFLIAFSSPVQRLVQGVGCCCLGPVTWGSGIGFRVEGSWFSVQG